MCPAFLYGCCTFIDCRKIHVPQISGIWYYLRQQMVKDQNPNTRQSGLEEAVTGRMQTLMQKGITWKEYNLKQEVYGRQFARDLALSG